MDFSLDNKRNQREPRADQQLIPQYRPGPQPGHLCFCKGTLSRFIKRGRESGLTQRKPSRLYNHIKR